MISNHEEMILRSETETKRLQEKKDLTLAVWQCGVSDILLSCFLFFSVFGANLKLLAHASQSFLWRKRERESFSSSLTIALHRSICGFYIYSHTYHYTKSFSEKLVEHFRVKSTSSCRCYFFFQELRESFKDVR